MNASKCSANFIGRGVVTYEVTASRRLGKFSANGYQDAYQEQSSLTIGVVILVILATMFHEIRCHDGEATTAHAENRHFLKWH